MAGRKHYYLFRYAPGHFRGGEGKTVQEACRQAFGCVYGPESAVKYKDMGTTSPAYFPVYKKQEFHKDKNWLDMP